jgi:CrcB protein
MRGVWVGVAGFFGAISRYWLDGWVSRFAGRGFPWGILVVNVSGCFAVGLVTTLFAERFIRHPTLQIAITVGFVGAYTTFSTFAFQTLRQIEEGTIGLAVAYVLASVWVSQRPGWESLPQRRYDLSRCTDLTL